MGISITAKLLTVQQELVAPKSNYNSFGKYHYRSCEDILEGLKPCLAKVKAAVTVSDEIVLIGERYYIKATATLRDTETNEYISNTAYAREETEKKGMDASQLTGSTSSYARKYALNGLFCIDDVKDADTRDNRQKEAKEQQKAETEQKKIEASVIPEVKVKALLARCESEGVAPAKICKLYKVNSLADLTELKFANINIHWEDIKAAK
jgi:hypothetical protein